jgi:nucleoside-diphosphate-sugar epimerase
MTRIGEGCRDDRSRKTLRPVDSRLNLAGMTNRGVDSRLNLAGMTNRGVDSRLNLAGMTNRIDRKWMVDGMALVLVTGGGGFIGSHIVDRMLQEGHAVRVLDNFSTGRRENLAHLEGNPNVEIIEGDICDQDLMSQVMEGVAYVSHQAAIPSVPRSVQDPWGSHRANSEGILRVLMTAKEAGVRRVVFASSSAVYGDVDDGRGGQRPKEESLPSAPLSPYAATKLTGEAYCSAFYHSYGLETVSLRYFNIFGPRQDPTSHYASVIPRFIRALKAGKRPTIFGDGHQTRDFTYVDNVVEANRLAFSAPRAPGRAINVACGQSISVLHLLQTTAEILGLPAAAEFGPPRPGDVRHSRAAIARAKDLLDYSPSVMFTEGIRRTVESCDEAIGGSG